MRNPVQGTVILGGGLDLITPPLAVPPGRLLQIKNFECDLNNGYRVSKGYERFDGRTSPAVSDYYVLQVESLTGWQVGEVITGGTSGATSQIFLKGASDLYITELAGAYEEDEELTGSISATTGVYTVSGKNILLNDTEVTNEVRYAKELYLRNKIQRVPGVGPVLGSFRHLDICLAARNFDATEARMYRSTASGWEQVAASYIAFFDSVKDINLLVQGVTVSDGTNTATLVSHSVRTTGSNNGYLVLSAYTAGFEDNATITVGGDTAVQLSADALLIKLQPNGRFEFLSHNFTGGPNRFRVYFCDGKNPTFEYDVQKNVISPIYTDQLNTGSDTPKFLVVYRNHLFLGFDAGLMRNSEPGDPYLWDAAAGTVEFSIGAPISGFDSTASALLIATSRDTFALTGQVAENFSLDTAADRVGARPYTLAHISTTYMLDNRGIVSLRRAQEFGNFLDSTISRLIQPLLTNLKTSIVSSTVVLTTNVYKLFTSDGRGISVTFQEGQAIGFGAFDLGVGVYTTSSAEDAAGEERILLSSTDGYVYELERGRSFDGLEKESWLRTVYHYLETPAFRKKFYRAFIGTVISGVATLKIGADFSLGSEDTNSLRTLNEKVSGQDGSWDIGLYDKAVFDGKIVGDIYLDLEGTGESISLTFNHKSATDDIFTIKDILYSYKLRRPQRARR